MNNLQSDRKFKTLKLQGKIAVKIQHLIFNAHFRKKHLSPSPKTHTFEMFILHCHLKNNTCSLIIPLLLLAGTAPLWIFVLGQYFHREADIEERGERIIPIYNFEIWLAATFFAYTAGLLINRFKPSVAEALLMWIIKPLLLLATILYITLGVYINMYVFELIDNFAVLGAVLLPVCGCLIGFVLSVVCRQKAAFVKTIALETSSLNCLIVLAALRFSLPHEVSDMASTVPIWVMFTIPGLYGVLAILQMVKRFIENFLESRKFKEARSFSVASGIVTQPGMAALSAPLFVSEAEDSDHHTANEKVTVL